MSDAFVGEIKLFSGNYAPRNWAICNGSLLNISDYEQLYSLLGTTYGGDGRLTFGLPDMRGRVPVGQGQGAGLTGRALGQMFGAEEVTLTEAQLPLHTHVWAVSTGNGSTNVPGGTAMLAKPAGTTNNANMYRAPDEPGLTTTPGPDDMISPFGPGQSHGNIMPSMVLNYIICLAGNYPTRP